MSNKKSIIIEIMKDFIKYGYGLKTFKEFDYPICKDFTEVEINELWKKAFNEMRF